MKEKIYVGTFEFDKEDINVLVCSLKLYGKTNCDKKEICDYLITRLKYLKVENF